MIIDKSETLHRVKRLPSSLVQNICDTHDVVPNYGLEFFYFDLYKLELMFSLRKNIEFVFDIEPSPISVQRQENIS